MKIAIDARMYGSEQFSGIGIYIQKLTDELFKLDAENEYIMFMREPWFSRFVLPNERVKKALVTSKHYSYAEQVKLPFEFMREKFDLIHYPHFNSPILYPKKSVYTIHDLTPFFYPGHKAKSGWRQWAYRAVFRSTVVKAKHIIAVSENTKREIIKYFNVNPQKITVTYEGVDERFKIYDKNAIINSTKSPESAGNNHRLSMATKFGITKPYIFFIGVWRSHKNIEGLIKAFTLLKKKYTLDCQLVLGGREDLHYTEARRQIEKSHYKQDIITLGYVADNDLPLLYNHAELFVLPSFIEGFGLIGIEAQSCGCPVVSTNTSSMPEVLSDSALFFNPNNVDEMAEKIHAVLASPILKQSLIDKGLRNAERFNWKKCAGETLRVYKEVEKLQ